MDKPAKNLDMQIFTGADMMVTENNSTKTEHPRVNPLAEKTFAAMEQIILKSNGELLNAYRNDFYEIDREFLDRYCIPGVEMFWVVRPSGTDITLAGVPTYTLDSAIYFAATSGAQCFSVKDGKLKKVTAKPLNDSAANAAFSFGNGAVKKGRTVLANYIVKTERGIGRVDHELSYTLADSASSSKSAMSLHDLMALELMGPGIVRAELSTLLGPTKGTFVNHVEIGAMIDARKLLLFAR